MRKNALNEYYGERAPQYEQIYYRDHEGRRQELAAEAKRLSALAAAKKVLELACGTGYWTEVMSRTAQGILASDYSPEMIAEAKPKQFGCPVSFVAADMFTHPFDQNGFDLVALGFWFSHQPRQEYDKLFNVLCQPLKQGGLIWMIDNNPSAEGGVHKSLRDDEHGNHFQERQLPDGHSYEIIKNYFSQSDLESLLSPRFELRSVVYGEFYWSATLSAK